MKRFLKILLAVFLILAGVLIVMGYKQFSLPDSSEMKVFFLEHQPAFKQKNASILTTLERQGRIATTGNPEIGYKWLQIEPEHYQPGQPLVIRYYTHLRGLGVGGFGTGIAYMSPGATERLYPTIEAMDKDAKKIEGFLGYSPISGNWYSFRWEAD